jgi:uncharacterized protein (DUF305 family)
VKAPLQRHHFAVHESAIAMANVALQESEDPKILRIARI